MSGDRWLGLALIVGTMVLVGSGLIARRLPPRRTAAIALAWAGIFAFALLVARAFT